MLLDSANTQYVYPTRLARDIFISQSIKINNNWIEGSYNVDILTELVYSL